MNLFSRQKKAFLITLSFLSLASLFFILLGSENDSTYYQEVRESRMGVLEKVKRGKGNEKAAFITQHREGVNRTVLRGEGHKQLFTVAAKSADVRMNIKKDSSGIIEEYHSARGIFQEDLYYFLGDKKIVEIDGIFKDVAGKTVSLTEKERGQLRPYQRIRTVLAEKVVWDFDKDMIDAYACDFALFTIPSHTIPDDLFNRTPDTVGYADRMNILLNVQGREKVTAEGLKMKMQTGAFPW